MTVSASDRLQIPIFVGRDAEGEISNHIIMAKTKNEEKQMDENVKSPEKKNSVRCPFSFVEKKYYTKSLEGRFQTKIQTAIGGTESTVKTDTAKHLTENSFRDHYFRPKGKHEESRPSTPTVKSIQKTGTVSEVLMANTADGTKCAVAS